MDIGWVCIRQSYVHLLHMTEVFTMSCFITRKKDKISAVFEAVGTDADEESFIVAFKKLYPHDWLKINERWQLEEDSTPPGKKHSMQHPDEYMKEMYRNHKPKAAARSTV